MRAQSCVQKELPVPVWCLVWCSEANYELLHRAVPPADLYDVIKHHRERQSAMLPHVFKSAM